MHEDERPTLFGMAAHADFIVLLCAPPAGQKSHVLAMAIGTGEQPLVNTMMEGHRKSRALFPMAIQAQRCRWSAIQIFAAAHGMKVLTVFAGVALIASDLVLPVLGSNEICLAGSLVMAVKAGIGSLQSCFGLKGQDILLFGIVGMCVARAMAGFATLALGGLFGFS
jgi:hypothetical protein